MTAGKDGGAGVEYPIRARVRADAKRQIIHPHMPQPGGEIRVSTTDGELYVCSKGFYWFAETLDILPDAAGVPEAVAEGSPSPSDKEIIKELVKYVTHGVYGGPMCEMSKHSSYPCTCGLDALLAKIEGRAV
jgi:hypothetical protein